LSGQRTDRYARRGGPVPAIYPGTVAGVSQAVADAKTESRFSLATITVWAVRGRERQCIRAFIAGREQESE
jgi:hypothetical protein